MTLKECILINNKCYRKATPAKMTGIVVHDTGAGNPNLKRYVQADPSQSYYKEVQEDLGINTAGNDWNKDNERYACVHAFIGKNAKGEIETYKTLPYDISCWGVGNGAKGSYNYNPTARIQFEICDDGYQSLEYFNKAMKEAQEYCAYLCKLYGWTANEICSHHESYLLGYGGNHGDCDGWLAKFGKNMDWFREEVSKLLNNKQKEDDKPMTAAEKKSFDELVTRVKELEKSNKIYHYWSEIPSWAQKPLKAMYDAKYFSGASASDLGLHKVKMETLVSIASILKSEGKINY